MADKKSLIPLTKNQVKNLIAQGCTAENWSTVYIDKETDMDCIRNTHFIGSVRIGKLSGKLNSVWGLEKPSGIYNATIANCSIGDYVRIANISVHIAGYDIADGVCIENVDTMQTNAGATFGNGVEIAPINEAGGREVILFDQLSAQFAYIMCLHKYRPGLIKNLETMANKYAISQKSDRGKVGPNTRICSSIEIIDVNIGPYATINGALSLVNGTVLSSLEAPTIIGSKVIAKDFVCAESSSITEGAILNKVFVGQGCRVGKQYSMENSVFFANCEAFHGEACSIFAGPYTVTHHKSTLLIAGLFSFYNAGSGTNQSNHMYKLGPVHEGKLQRGTKTGSFSYLKWPCRTGPFSIILGKHATSFDVSDFPFSHLEARNDGKCSMVPGLHLTTVGTFRDAKKWLTRDRRKGHLKRDVISFDILSPYAVAKMLKASDTLKDLWENSEKTIEDVSIGGTIVKRLMLRTGQRYYHMGIEMYLLEKVVEKVETALNNGQLKKISDAFAADDSAVYSSEWLDIGGQMMPKKRLSDLENAVENGSIATIDDFAKQIWKIDESYRIDEWLWVKNTYKQVFGSDLDNATKEDVINAAQKFLQVKTKFLRLVIADSEKDFAGLSQCGFGQDGNNEDAEKDFNQVRGIYEENKFVREMRDDIQKLQQRIELLVRRLSTPRPQENSACHTSL